jgi:hypothetical protein
MDRRHSFAALIRETLRRPGPVFEARVLAVAEELEALASELDDPNRARPARAVACMRLVSDPTAGPLLNQRCPLRNCARASARSDPASAPAGALPDPGPLDEAFARSRFWNHRMALGNPASARATSSVEHADRPPQ